jgi:ankyrin repeat/BTB/POZ domain-containing protein 1
MNEDGEIDAETAEAISNAAAGTDKVTNNPLTNEALNEEQEQERDPITSPFMNNTIRTLDGDIAGDEFAADAINYQVLLGKIDRLLERLKLDA